MTAEETSKTEDMSPLARARPLIDSLSKPVFLMNPDGQFLFVNEALKKELRINRDLSGSSIGALKQSEAIDSEQIRTLREKVDEMTDGESDQQEVMLETKDPQLFHIQLEKVQQADSAVILGEIRRARDLERKMDVLKRQREAMFRLYEIEMNEDLSIAEKLQKTIDVGRDFFDLPIGFITSIDGTTHQFEQLLGSEEYAAGMEQPLEQTYCRLIDQGNDPLVLQDAEVELGADDPAFVTYGFRSYIGSEIPFGTDSYGTFCFAGSEPRERSFTETEREFIRLLGLWAGYQVERQFVEDMLRQLNALGRQLIRAESDEEIGQRLLDTIEELFEMRVSICFRYEEVDDALKPISRSDAARAVAPDVLRIQTENASHLQSFEQGDVRVFEHLLNETSGAPEQDRIKSVIHVPIGNEGLLVAGSTKYETIAPVILDSFQLLSDLARDAFVALEQKERLMERGEALQRQNERLEQFAGLVAHDLRNPLSGAFGFLEIARETKDETHFERVESALDRLRDLIDKLLALTRGTRADMDRTEISLDEVLREAWTYLETGDVELVVHEDPGWVYADETRLLQLFGNLIRNSIEHGGDDVIIEMGPMEEGFYLADNGPGLPEDVRQDLLTLGRTGAKDRPGLGLDSVTDIVDAHGWELALPDTENGARFEIYTGDSNT